MRRTLPVFLDVLDQLASLSLDFVSVSCRRHLVRRRDFRSAERCMRSR
jgi:hypothetical protein